MKAIRIHEHGGVEVLRFDDVDDPTPGTDEVVVRVKATSLNHVDIWLREGRPIELPHILGSDIAGEVASVGPGVSDEWQGKRVVVYPGLGTTSRHPRHPGDESFSLGFGIIGSSCDGGYAEYVKVPAANLVVLPESIDWITGAAYPLTFTTAWHMLTARCKVEPGMDVMVHGAGGGVGHAALQIAKLHGARVIATAGSDKKVEKARELGVDVGVNYSTEDFVAAALEATDGRGVDIVVDHIGGKTLSDSLRALAVGGTVVNCGVTTGSDVTIDLRTLYPRQLSIVGSMMGSSAELRHLTQFIADGRLKPVISRVLPWTEVREAHRLMEKRDLFGKIVLEVG